MARTRSAQYDDTRRALLGDAARRFAEQGYARTSIADLAEACGVSRGALYHYFETKEAMLFAILDEHVRGLIAELEAGLAGVEGARPRLRQAIAISLANYAHSRAEQIVLLNDLAFLGAAEQARIKTLQRRIVALYADLLEDLDEGGRLGARTRKVYAMMLLGMINYTYAWYDPAGAVRPRELAERVADLFLDGFAR